LTSLKFSPQTAKLQEAWGLDADLRNDFDAGAELMKRARMQTKTLRGPSAEARTKSSVKRRAMTKHAMANFSKRPCIKCSEQKQVYRCALDNIPIHLR
jgi:hypothetical protein